ncbi:uncharacterized protein BJ212DRAFT_477169 [Suillus subaureus]|uniref:Uncharacterized protein n=1 Tax=Suillus subaureus TaxID=48587 RepID=A0A9P7E6W0_9AGAM|nr:uncharacterized protein BJ212DRAFT_477169 [Suillus subaureus]KAG1812193.1 hypothetical protein BJ212DRAFT_477169 [Suillus subaureus]
MYPCVYCCSLCLQGRRLCNLNMCSTERLSKGHQSPIAYYTKHHIVSINFICHTQHTAGRISMLKTVVYTTKERGSWKVLSVRSVRSVRPVLSVPIVRQTVITLKCAADRLTGIFDLTLDIMTTFAALATGLKDISLVRLYRPVMPKAGPNPEAFRIAELGSDRMNGTDGHFQFSGIYLQANNSFHSHSECSKISLDRFNKLYDYLRAQTMRNKIRYNKIYQI